MKRTIYIALTFLALTLFAIPQRGIESARYLVFSDDSAPTAADYVQDGLIAMWDAIENVGWDTHDPDSTVWVNLVDSGYFALGESHVFGSDRLIAQANSPEVQYSMPFAGYDNRTMEVAAQVPDTGYSQIRVMGLSGGGDSIYATWVANGNIAFRARAYTSSTEVWQGKVSAVNGFTATLSRDYSKNLRFYYINGELGKSVSAPYQSPSGYVFLPVAKTDIYYFNIRIYSRTLTADEIAWNHQIDRLRFNLP